jgi:xylulokinase
MKLTGEINTTISGLSEGIFWDFKEQRLAEEVISYFGFEESMIPEIVPTFSVHGKLSARAAQETGLAQGTEVAYRAGDQPNNAFALGVNNPGEVAATGGTSGVVYGITDQALYDPKSRVNTFAHVNHSWIDFRAGVLLCINGAGITYSWLKNQVAESGMTFPEMEELASLVTPNSDGLRVIPFGNGAERILQNENIGANVMNLNFNRHGRAHLFRAGLEGVAYSFVYGIEVLKELGMNINSMRVGNDNLFQSRIFAETITGLLGCQIDVVATTGASGAARAAGFGSGRYHSIDEAAKSEEVVNTYETGFISEMNKGYEAWKSNLMKLV